MNEVDEILKVRERIHKLADVVQSHETRLAQHDVLIQTHTSALETVRQSTREQVDGAVKMIELTIESAVNQTKMQLQSLQDDIAPIKRGIYWIVTLILGSVVLAVLALVLKK
jgi:chromosome segregation ATPase